MNALLLKGLQKRFPTTRPYFFREPPILEPWHRMTDHFYCVLCLPSVKTQDPQEALSIFLPYARAYVDTINNVREIRPYLTVFPFSIKVWSFVVDFARDPETGLFYYSPFLSGIICRGNEFLIDLLHKEQKSPDGKTLRNVYENIYETPKVLPEAIHQMMSPRFDEKKEPVAIPVTSTYCLFNDGLEREFHYFTDFAKKRGYLLIALDSIFGFGDAHSPQSCCFGVAFAAQEKYLSLDEAKELVSTIRQTFIQFSNGYEKLGNWVNQFRKRKIETCSPTINLQEYMGFRISFWDKYIDRVKPPHIAEIKVIGPKAKYYVSDELQRIQLIYEEDLPSYEVEVPVSDEVLAKLSKENISE